ncbi:MAG: DUF4401 domain-containing protein [bacterium]
MMRLSVGELMGQLRAERLATDAHIQIVRDAMTASTDDDIPVYLRVVVGIGAWIAACFLLASFVALVREEGAATIVGVVVLAVAVWGRQLSGGEFLRQATVAGSFAGQGLIAFGLARLTNGEGIASLVAMVLSIVLVLIMRDRFHRFLSTMIAVLSMAVGLNAAHVPGFLDVVALLVAGAAAAAWRINVRDRSDEADELLTPVGYGLVVALFGLMLFGASSSTLASGYQEHPQLGVATTSGIALLLDVLARVIFAEHYARHRSVTGIALLGGLALFALLTMDSPGIIAGVAVLILGFDRRNSVLVEMGVAFLLVFGAAYYYSLDLTLLQKSGVLAGSGAVCLAARALLGSPAPVKPGEAVR